MRKELELAERKAKDLYKAIEVRGLVVPGKTERELNDEIATLAENVFCVERFWHKKIIRAGVNTLVPYSSDPPDVVIQSDDLVIVDFGPVFNGWEADLARTYVMGADPRKLKIKDDVELAWQEANSWFTRQDSLTGAEFHYYITELSAHYGYEYGGEIAGHIVGSYPHEQLGPGNLGLDIHPDNHQDMFLKDPQGQSRHWILEMHFVDRSSRNGAFFEQLLTRTI